jgi:hypothetical protein
MRLDLDEVMALIEQQKYFVLHAPRQTGKTSSLLALMEYLNQGERYRCVYVNVELAQAAREDVGQGMRAILSQLATMARTLVNDHYPEEIWEATLEKNGGYAALHKVLSLWAEHSPRPIVLLMDEVDALVGDTLIAVLRQLRTGYFQRPALFPQSIVLCGVRDVRDYRIYSERDKAIITGGSAFNVKAASLRLGDFTRADVQTLYAQHTAETGQPFEPGALDLVWALTQGQPWLVNALGYETCFEMKQGRDRTVPITAALVSEAKERLILRRETHLDQLADKLREERVRRVIAPLLVGDVSPDLIPTDDIMYVRDLGLIQTEGQLRIANPIYQEIIPRELTYSTQLTIAHQPAWYIRADGRLNVDKLLVAFQDFFRQHAEHWVERFDYKEAGPQLLLQAFLQRIVNNDGRIEREYGLGRLRTDLLVVWPHPGGVQRVVLELKIVYGSLESTLEKGLAQTWEYMDRCRADGGHLVLFDREKDKPWEARIFRRVETYRGMPITVWGM